MCNNDFKELKDGCLKLSSNGDVVRVKGLGIDVSLVCYDEDGNYVGKIPVNEVCDKEVK